MEAVGNGIAMQATPGTGKPDDRRAFILQHTHLRPLPSVPELQLHLAGEIEPIWRLMTVELCEGNAPLPYWAFAWVGGQAIARYLLDHRQDVAGKRVLDFATGSGLCAVAAMKAGARSALAADVDPFAAEAVALNAEANGVQVTFTDLDLLDAEPPDTDLILAGDVCYEKPLAARVVPWLEAAHRRGIRVLLGDPGRPYLPREHVVRLAAYQIVTTRQLEDREVKQSAVFTPLCKSTCKVRGAL